MMSPAMHSGIVSPQSGSLGMLRGGSMCKLNSGYHSFSKKGKSLYAIFTGILWRPYVFPEHVMFFFMDAQEQQAQLKAVLYSRLANSL
jgi:hypothetical protein